MTESNKTAIIKDQIYLSTEEKIIVAARKVFTKKGLSGARMQDIADEAGINKALLHYYFRSKDKLFEKIFEEGSKKMFMTVNALVESADLNLFQKIEKIIEAHIQIEIENPYIPAFIMNEANQNPEFIKKFLQDTIKLPIKLVEQIQEGINLGHIRPINPVQLFMNIMSLSAFPFIAKPIFQTSFGITDEQFFMLMEQRKKHVVEFIINAIKL